MSDTEPVIGKVAKIVSDREIILNKGVKQGLYQGDYVIVLDPSTQSVIDPDTGIDLGGLKRVKAVLRVVESADTLALAKTFRTRKVQVGGGVGVPGLAGILAEPKYETRVETLKFDPRAGMPIDEEDSAIAVGDPFETITMDEAEDTKTVTLWR